MRSACRYFYDKFVRQLYTENVRLKNVKCVISKSVSCFLSLLWQFKLGLIWHYIMRGKFDNVGFSHSTIFSIVKNYCIIHWLIDDIYIKSIWAPANRSETVGLTRAYFRWYHFEALKDIVPALKIHRSIPRRDYIQVDDASERRWNSREAMLQ